MDLNAGLTYGPNDSSDFQPPSGPKRTRTVSSGAYCLGYKIFHTLATKATEEKYVDLAVEH